jgi:hypothetical protein
MPSKYFAVSVNGMSSEDVYSGMYKRNELLDMILDTFDLRELKYSDIDISMFPFPIVKKDDDDIEYDFTSCKDWCDAALSYESSNGNRIIQIIKINGKFTTEEF